MAFAQARTNASFQTRLLLHLANRRRRHAGSEGFTLVELMIVVAILGILAAVALPNYLQARSSSAIGSRVSEAVSFSKACAVYQSTGVGAIPNNTAGKYDADDDGVKFTTPCSSSAGEVSAKWGNVGAKGVKCLTAESDVNHRVAKITIIPSNTDDQIKCTFSES